MSRLYRDADSHLMELPDFLTAHADPGTRARMPRLYKIDDPDYLGGMGVPTDGQRAHPADVAAGLASTWHADILRGPKWYRALGAFDPSERSRVLDILGFESQVVFTSFAGGAVIALDDLGVAYAAARAHNRGMAEFCSDDSRLLGVAVLLLDDVTRALSEIDACLAAGLRLFWLPGRAPGGRSPGHVDHDPVWARLAEAAAPFVLHVGSNPLTIDPEWMNDGHPDRRTARGGAEVVGSKDMTTIFHGAERFLSVLVLDGVLDRFPSLRGACIELGAGWVPSMLDRLDHVVGIWSRSEPHLAEFGRRPSEQAPNQLRFTPYPFEDVGALIQQSEPRLYLFSTDYPHAEGGRDPIGRFDVSLASSGADDETVARFYGGNFGDLIFA